MRYIIIIHEGKQSHKIATIFRDNFNVQYSDNHIEIQPKQNKNSYVVFDYCEQLRYEFDKKERAIFSELKSPMYSFIKYSDLPFLKIVLELFVLKVNCYIDNDHNTLLDGLAFVKKLGNNPFWDWTIDL